MCVEREREHAHSVFGGGGCDSNDSDNGTSSSNMAVQQACVTCIFIPRVDLHTLPNSSLLLC